MLKIGFSDPRNIKFLREHAPKTLGNSRLRHLFPRPPHQHPGDATAACVQKHKYHPMTLKEY